MKHSTEKHNIADQSKSCVQKPQKHDVNLQKNSTLFFQIGLIVCLLATYGLFEMKFETKAVEITQLPPLDIDEEIEIKNFKEFKEEVKPVEPVKPVQKLGAKDPIIKDDDYVSKALKTVISTLETTNKPIMDPGSIKVEKVTETNLVPWVFLEKVPIYPGCESAKTNGERTKCMSAKLSKLVQNTFDQSLLSELGLNGLQKIDVQFTIDKTGYITDIKTRAPNAQLEKEALRVVKKIPMVKPGLQRGKPVSVIYNLPILLKVQ